MWKATDQQPTTSNHSMKPKPLRTSNSAELQQARTELESEKEKKSGEGRDTRVLHLPARRKLSPPERAQGSINTAEFQELLARAMDSRVDGRIMP